jgi:hypothetical protein
MSDRSLRAVGIALALVAGAIHLALSQANLIPGEVTATPAFAAMGLGFLGCAALVAFTRGDLLVVVPIYSISLLFAYAITRGQYPIEVYGIVSKLAELGLAIAATALFRQTAARSSTR